MEAKDAKTAGDVLTLLNTFRDQLKQHYDETRDGLLNGAPPDAEEHSSIASPLTCKRNFTAKTEGSHVQMSVKRPAATKDLIAWLGPHAKELLNPKPTMVPEGPPPPPLRPVLPLEDVRDLGAAWVRDNNVFGPDHKIVADAARQLHEQVKPGEGFLLLLGSKILKSRKPTVLVGWGGEVLALELTPDQAKDISIIDAGMVVQTVPAADDDGREDPLGELSDLRFDMDDSPVGRQFIEGKTSYVRLRDETEFASLRLTLVSGGKRSILPSPGYSPFDRAGGERSFSWPTPKDGPPRGKPLVAILEAVAYRNPNAQGKPIIASKPTAATRDPAPGRGRAPPGPDEEKAAKAVMGLNAFVTRAEQLSGRPVVGLSLQGAAFTDDDLKNVAALKSLAR